MGASGAAAAVDLLDLPARGPVTSRFGWRRNPFGGRGRDFHPAIDIGTPYGTAVRAPQEGVVHYAGWNGGYGLYVQISHADGVVTAYGHLSRIVVQAGGRVRKGQLIGRTGSSGHSTGPHLDFAVQVDGEAVDPLAFLARSGGPALP